MVRVHYFAVMVTGMYFLKFYFYESQEDIPEKHLQKKKDKKKNVNGFFIAVLLHFYDLNSTKSRLSNQKSGMVLEVTLILIKKWTLSSYFKYVSIFKTDEIRVRGSFSPPTVKYVGSEATWNRVNHHHYNILICNGYHLFLPLKFQ